MYFEIINLINLTIFSEFLEANRKIPNEFRSRDET